MSGSVLNPGVRVVSVKGSTLLVGAVTFQVDGRVIHGLAADRPTAAAMHAVLPFAYYNSADTGVIAQTDGTNWVVQ